MNQLVDLRTKPRSRKITIIYKSKMRLTDMISFLNMEGYKTTIETINYHREGNDDDEAYEIIFDIKRKVKDFKPFLNRLSRDGACENLCLVDYALCTKELD